MEVKPGFSQGNDPADGEKSAEPLFDIRTPDSGVVGMNSGGGDETRVFLNQVQGGLGTVLVFADHHDPGYASRPGPLQHLAPVGRVGCVS